MCDYSWSCCGPTCSGYPFINVKVAGSSPSRRKAIAQSVEHESLRAISGATLSPAPPVFRVVNWAEETRLPYQNGAAAKAESLTELTARPILHTNIELRTHAKRQRGTRWQKTPLISQVLKSEHLRSPDVWNKLIPTMGLGALVRNLGRMTENGTLAPGNEALDALLA
jgi:hypothetical protein